MRIAIGNDHRGYTLKSSIIDYLTGQGHHLEDMGCYSGDRVDYPDFGHAVCEKVEAQDVDLGIVICGSGNGINMTCNKHKGIRSALCWNKEVAALARQHNNANVIALPADFLELAESLEIVEAFLNNTFEGGRHLNRVNKIPLSC